MLPLSLKLSATPINEALAGLEREGLVTYSPHRGAFEEHNDIYQAIRNRDPARAESSMRTHLHNAKTAVEHAVVEEAGTGS